MFFFYFDEAVWHPIALSSFADASLSCPGRVQFVISSWVFASWAQLEVFGVLVTVYHGRLGLLWGRAGPGGSWGSRRACFGVSLVVRSWGAAVLPLSSLPALGARPLLPSRLSLPSLSLSFLLALSPSLLFSFSPSLSLYLSISLYRSLSLSLYI